MMIKHFLTFIKVLTLFLCVTQHSLAQGLIDYNWYFGNNQRAILFNKSDNEPAIDSLITPPNALGGSAVANDPVTGDLIFYADGDNIYDRDHNIMFGDLGLSSQSGDNQPVGIAPEPNIDDSYYVFYRNPAGDLEYSLIDMGSLGNAAPGSPVLGEVSQPNQATTVNTINPNFIIVSEVDKLYYLITQNSGSGQIQSHRVDAGGVLTPMSAITLPAAFTVENFSFSSVAGKIAVSSTDANANVHLIDIDAMNGVLTYDQEIFNTANTDPTLPSIYDTEWSSNGNFLYVSRHGDAGMVADVLQVDLLTPLATPVSILPTAIDRSFGLKRGPDGRIYHLFQNIPNPIRIARINEPDSIAANVDYEIDPLGDFDFTGQQFPEFAPVPIPDIELDITAFDFCLNGTTKFFPIFETTPSSFTWNFGDGIGVSNLVSPIYTYQNPGSYQVTLAAMINGQMDTATTVVNIIDNNLQVNLADTTICPGESVVLDATTEGAISYTWNTNETTPTITVDSAGTYWVVVTHTNGCTAYGSAQVTVVGNTDQRANSG
jgi:hypothetical protein